MGAEAALAGGLISGGMGLIGTSQTNRANAKIANSQMAFEKEQADTIYQRGVADLKAAGLNPMLAVGKPAGQADATPYTYQSPMIGAMDKAIANFSAVQGARQTEAGISKTKADTNLSNAMAAKAVADTTSATSANMLNLAQVDKLKSSPWMSNIIGTDAASKVSQFGNSAASNIADKIPSLISQIGNSSAAAYDHTIGRIADLTAGWIKHGDFKGMNRQPPAYSNDWLSEVVP